MRDKHLIVLQNYNVNCFLWLASPRSDGPCLCWKPFTVMKATFITRFPIATSNVDRTIRIHKTQYFSTHSPYTLERRYIDVSWFSGDYYLEADMLQLTETVVIKNKTIYQSNNLKWRENNIYIYQSVWTRRIVNIQLKLFIPTNCFLNS